MTGGAGEHAGASFSRPAVPIADNAISLVPIAPEHVDAFEVLGNDPLVQRFTRVPDPFGRSEAEWWIGLYEQGWEEGSRAGFAIVERSGGAFVGMIAFVRLQLELGEAEVGYIVAPQARGRGVATRALALLSGWGFRELGLERIELRAELTNPASLKVAERCGFVREGTVRNVHLKAGRRGDMALYSRLASDGLR